MIRFRRDYWGSVFYSGSGTVIHTLEINQWLLYRIEKMGLFWNMNVWPSKLMEKCASSACDMYSLSTNREQKILYNFRFIVCP